MDQQESDCTVILKEELWKNFSSYMKLNVTVNRERFFAYLGIALENVGYGKVKPVSKKGSRTAYMGLCFKAQEKSSKFKPDALDSVNSRNNTVQPGNVQQWMERSFCEGGEADEIAKKELWMKFKKEMQAKEDTKSIFFFPFLEIQSLKILHF